MPIGDLGPELTVLLGAVAILILAMWLPRDRHGWCAGLTLAVLAVAAVWAAAQLGAAAGDAGHGPRGAAGPACRRPGGVDRRARAGRRSARGKRVPCREGRGGGMFRRRPSRYDRCLVTT